MRESTFDQCFLITINGPEYFGIVGIQTNNILDLNIALFSYKKKKEVQKAQF